MTDLMGLYRLAEEQGVTVDCFQLGARESISLQDGEDCFIAIDPFQLSSSQDEKLKLAHELGHCMKGWAFSVPLFRKDGRYQKKATLSDGRQRTVYGRTIAEVNQAADALRDQDRQVMVSIAELSEASQSKVLLTMRQRFLTARKNGLVLADPTEGVKITPHARPKKKEYLTLEEQEALMAALESADPRARCFVGLCPG